MKCAKILSLLAVILLLNPAKGRSGDPQEKPVLWNITSSGDTLHYVNIFPESTLKKNLDIPGYFVPACYDSIKQNLERRQGHFLISSNTLTLLKQSRQYPNNIQRLKPERKPVWFPVALILASGATSAYFKLEANKTYDRYQHSIDRKNISKYYDLTRKYDTVSGISFVLFQVGFGWLTYELIW